MKTKIVEIEGKLYRIYCVTLSNGRELRIDKTLADAYRYGYLDFIRRQVQIAEGFQGREVWL